MRLYKLKPPKRRAQTPFKPEDMNNPEVKYPNLLWNTETKDFIELTHPNQAWAEDFTYLWFGNKFYYVATVLDVYTKELLGFAISDIHDTHLILEALQHALASTKRKPDILHSDQGSEYTSAEFQSFVLAQDIKLSYSRKSSPWQNGFQESYYNNFKLDLGNMNQFEVAEELVVGVSHTIFLYNTKRMHTTINTTPRQFYQNYQLNLLKTAVS
jgi:putative transposase